MTGVLARIGAVWTSVVGPREPSFEERLAEHRAWSARVDEEYRRSRDRFEVELRESERQMGLELFPHEVWPFLYDAPDIALLGPLLPSLAEVERFGEVTHEKTHYHVVRLVDDWRHPATGAPVDWWVTTRDHTRALERELRQMPRGGPGDNWTLCLCRTHTGDLEIWGRS